MKKVEPLMEEVNIVANVEEKYGQKDCKVVKKNIVNKDTATSLLIVKVKDIFLNIKNL